MQQHSNNFENLNLTEKQLKTIEDIYQLINRGQSNGNEMKYEIITDKIVLHFNGFAEGTFIEFTIDTNGNYLFTTSNDRVITKEFGNDENIFQIEHFIEQFL